jgi:hypothetical protein
VYPENDSKIGFGIQANQLTGEKREEFNFNFGAFRLCLHGSGICGRKFIVNNRVISPW